MASKKSRAKSPRLGRPANRRREGKTRSSPTGAAVASSLRRLSSRTRILIAAAGAALLLCVAIGFELWRGSATRSDAAAEFVGSETCAGCHEAEVRLWQSSHHKLAMEHATERSVLGDFNDAGFDYYGVRSRFFRKDGDFFVETDGPDGKLATFQVKFTFGVDPLQQYLIEFPDGRVQALSIAWD